MDQVQISERLYWESGLLDEYNAILTRLNEFRSLFLENGEETTLVEFVNELSRVDAALQLGPDEMAAFNSELLAVQIEGRVAGFLQGPNGPTLQKACADIEALRVCFTRILVLNLFPGNSQHELLLELKRQTYAITSIIERLQLIVSETHKLRQQIHASALAFGAPPDLMNLLNLKSALASAFGTLATRASLIVKEEPRQVLLHGTGRAARRRPRQETPSRTDMTVQLITLPGILVENPTIRIYLIEKPLANTIHNTGRVPAEVEVGGEISASLEADGQEDDGHNSLTATMTPLQTSDEINWVYEVEVRNLYISSPPHRHYGLDVGKQKFCFLVTAELRTTAGESLTAWTISAPVTIRTHSSQILDCFATVNRDAYFSTIVRSPFDVRADASWMEVEAMLTDYIQVVGKVSVSGAQKLFLRNKMQRTLEFWRNREPPGSNRVFDLDHIPLDSFYKERMDNATFSFWAWIYEWCELLLKHQQYFGHLVRAGYIESFIGREEAGRLLRQQGDFVVRCSESEFGSLSVIFAQQDVRMQLVAGSFLIELKKENFAHFKFLSNIHNLQVNAGGAVRPAAFLNVMSRTIFQGVDKALAFPHTPEYLEYLARPVVGPYNPVGPAVVI